MNHQYDEFTDFKTMLTKIILQWLSVWFRQKRCISKFNIDKLISKLPIDKQTGWDENKRYFCK